MKELILMTAAYRIDNLVQSYDSIVDNFKDKNDIHITWLICYDQYNAKGDIGHIKALCEEGLKSFGMGYLIYNAGKPNQPNYGGTLYNDALKWVKANWFNDSDPWVYIFDDDNIIHPTMASSFNTMANTCEEKNRSIIWMTGQRSQGCTDVANKRIAFSYHIFPNGSKEAIVGLPDPSQIIMKYSTIEDMGFYDEGLMYDAKIWNYIDAHIDNVTFPNDWYGVSDRTVFTQSQCFHNGQIAQEDIDDAKKCLNEGIYTLICQSNSPFYGIAHRFFLPNDIGSDTFNKMVRYYEKKSYIKRDENNFFYDIDQIYILTLVDTPNRWDFVIKQFKSLGIYDFVKDKIQLIKGVKIPGITSRIVEDVTVEGRANLYHDSSNSYNVGYFNCTNEHYRILKQAIAEGYSKIMVIEDDACFFKNIEILKHAIKTMPEDFDILHLEGYFNPANEDSYNESLSYLAKTPEDGKWDTMEHLPLWATACLIYSEKGMKRYIAEQEDFLVGVDVRTELLRDNSYYYTYPLVRQEDRTLLDSSIDTKKIGDRTNIYLHFTNREDYFSIFDI